MRGCDAYILSQMLDLITHLFRLRTVVEEGSMRRAAGILNVTQPALTRSIAQLEARFGQPLLVRHSRGVAPTEFGERVVSSVRRLSRHWELAELDLASGETRSGRLRIRAGPLWRVIVLPGLVVELQREFPELVVEMQNLGGGTALIDLVEGRCDVVFGGLQTDEEIERRLAQAQFTTIHDRVVAREDHPIFQGIDARRRLIDPARLLDYPWLVYTADPVYEAETFHAMVERTGAAPKVRATCESLIAAIALLQKGDFLCILPDAAVADAASPRIVPVPVELGRRKLRSGATFRTETAEWPPMRRLLELCGSFFVAADPAPLQRPAG
jgi:DNA-binding transcriptional LysR family regulator